MGYKDNYKNMGRSNLTFLNADGSQATHEQILNEIKQKLDAEILKISLTDTQRAIKIENLRAQANAKVLAENARYEAEKAKRMDDLFGRIGGTLTTTQNILTTLGINPPKADGSAPIGGKDNVPPKEKKDNTFLIVGGVVVALGIIGLVVYKMQK
jgi:hypothetical protein